MVGVRMDQLAEENLRRLAGAVIDLYSHQPWPHSNLICGGVLMLKSGGLHCR